MSVPPNDASYPTGPPKTAFERVIHSLDQESFNSLRYAYIDALLTFSLFSTKRESPRIWRPVVLENAFSTGKDIPKVLGITKEEGVLVCRMFKDSIPNDHPTRESCAEAALGVVKKFPRLFEEMDVEMMTHLLLRYFLLYSTESLVSFRKIEKIPDADEDDTTFEFGPGLKAIKHIPASTYILTANGSFSSNEVDAGVGGPFVIHVRTCLEPGAGDGAASEKTQRRLILGPMEFAIVNHDCKPNCQVSSVRFYPGRFGFLTRRLVST
ncbi:hypothetical protein BDN72DRAFT_578853 [Pluteus cervinus]|uniref:Uncharacterized protein n=1 Tax=Pluteus cervinus TaxID=181527 RepID=A0ACD3AWC8_9AGAR|nr:hypothetical protein BDN72DRAFT_578853 [Pluteus cervinus]